MTQLRTKRICEGYEPIPGYVLEESIGRGGYGEVWRSSAPGGLKKAVKFVFGAHDESRASRELKSLERIRGVQHPFLLTLERFEAIDDQLVIVTELADCSLEDIYRSNRDRGSCGIARNVLLSHLHDAADALDYLHEQYQLQHLDIKPGNLLLFGGHVKVADFGLLKDLGDVDCSMVGGLTPSYAPPELFDGRPSLHSDQYSLAVMYQELLTGTRPFSGRTIAQLATQHVHAAPNLDPLPASDRPVVARALEKNPERRFPNCMAFVEALMDASRRKTHITVERASAATPEAAAVQDLPQLAANQSRSTGNRSVLVVAIGGTGAKCLRLIRQRVVEAGDDCPIELQGLLIDTDVDTVHSMQVADLPDESSRCNYLHTPLRTPQQYRETGTGRLASISRRWIYNVPRSGATEGMRPLGRLALVDHGAKVRQALDDCVSSLPQETEDTPPAVYVVGSLCGGTGSGMYLDVVHLLRHSLDEAGQVESPILSLLVTPPLQADPSRVLAAHSALAAMNELTHFLKAGNGYPGDPGANWPSVPAARTPLHNVYFVPQPQRNSLSLPAEESIAQYLWTDGGTGRQLLASARKWQANENQTVAPSVVRTFGFSPLSDPRQSKREKLTPSLVRHLLIEWLGLPSQARQDSIELSRRVMRRSGISAETLQQSVDEPAIIGERIQSLSRELAVCLSDRRADVTTVIECLKRMLEWSESVELDIAEPFRESLQSILARMETYATGLAMAIVETSKSQAADNDPWKGLPDSMQQQFGLTLNELHSLVQNDWLVRPLMQPRFSVVPSAMVTEITRAAEPILSRVLDDSEHVDVAPDSDSMATIDFESQSQTEVTQAIEGLRASQAENQSLTVPEAVLAAKPALLVVGGMQRLLLIVGTSYEKQQLEPQVRAAFDGALSVALVSGATPHLIHEGQQLELTKIIAHLSALHGGNEQVTSRLASRSDVHW